MVGDKHTRAHIWKIQIFGKKRGGGVTHIFIFFEFLQKFIVGDKNLREHIFAKFKFLQKKLQIMLVKS